MNLSVIVAYRDREIKRVRNFIESLYENSNMSFELIFVDYGSSKDKIQELELICKRYPNITLIKVNSNGLFWNRAHALNVGINYATNDILLFADIDLIFSKFIISDLLKLNYEQCYYTFDCYYLPNRKLEYNDISEKIIRKSTIDYVGVFAVKKSYFIEVGAFDEYFYLWGVEDDDLYSRFDKIISRIRKSVNEFLMYHQWHFKNDDKLFTSLYFNMYSYMLSKSNNFYIGNSAGSNIEKRPILELHKSQFEEMICDENIKRIEFIVCDIMNRLTQPHGAKNLVFTIQKKKKSISDLFLIKRNVNIENNNYIHYFALMFSFFRMRIVDYNYNEENSFIRFYLMLK